MSFYDNLLLSILTDFNPFDQAGHFYAMCVILSYICMQKD